MSDQDRLPNIAESQRTPLVAQLLEQIEHLLEENRKQAEGIQQLRDEIAVLKGQKAKPKFKRAEWMPRPSPAVMAMSPMTPTAAITGPNVSRASAPARPSAAKPSS